MDTDDGEDFASQACYRTQFRRDSVWVHLHHRDRSIHIDRACPLHAHDNDSAWITTSGLSHQLTKLSANVIKTLMLEHRNHKT